MSGAPALTVLIPARNEEADIERCLEAVLSQDHPHDLMEVVLVDGGSTDRTVEVASRVLEVSDVRWKLIHNPAGTTPSNLNAGLEVATGEIVCRVDARSIVPPEYVRLCAEVLESRPEIAVTGGAQVAVALTESATSAGIARALNNRYAMGGSRYRSGASSGPTDTVYLGAFRADQLRAAGGWEPFFETNQDYELNRRMGQQGVVWFDDRLEVGYVPRQSLAALWQQYHRFGRWKVRYWRRTGDRPQPRQLVPLAGTPLVLLLSLAGRRSRRAPTPSGWSLMVLGLSALVAVDAVGAPREPQPTMPGRMVASVSTAVLVLAWVAGVAVEALFGGPLEESAP